MKTINKPLGRRMILCNLPKAAVLMAFAIGMTLTTNVFSQSWDLVGNNPGTSDFLGTQTSTNKDLVIKTNGVERLRFRYTGEIDWAPGGLLRVGTTSFMHLNGGSYGRNIIIGLDAAPTPSISSDNNTIMGFQAGASVDDAGNCTFIGTYAGYATVDAIKNTFVGVGTGYSHATGNHNTFIGNEAGGNDEEGEANTFLGNQAGLASESGSYNTFIGGSAGDANVTGSYNTYLGHNTDGGSTNLTNATAVGYNTIVNASNKIRLGNSSVTVVEGQVMYTTSDARFKTNITENEVKGLEFIKKLRPVVYNFNTRQFEDFLSKNMSEAERNTRMSQDFSASTKIRQSGFIAQEVEKAAQEVGYDFNGVHHPDNENDNYSLAYSQFVVPLVKGMQEQQEEIEALRLELKQQIAMLQQQISELSGKTLNPVSVDQSNPILYQNAPNPFTENTVIQYSVSGFSKSAKINVYQANTSTILYSFPITDKGIGSVNISAQTLQPGSYTYELVVDGKRIDVKKMVIIK